jgi:predicted site-specific integrase-resolvase
VDPSTVLRWIKAGKLASVEMPSGRKKVPAAEVDRHLVGGVQ